MFWLFDRVGFDKHLFEDGLCDICRLDLVKGNREDWDVAAPIAIPIATVCGSVTAIMYAKAIFSLF